MNCQYLKKEFSDFLSMLLISIGFNADPDPRILRTKKYYVTGKKTSHFFDPKKIALKTSK
jgi:hypothetical protein